MTAPHGFARLPADVMGDILLFAGGVRNVPAVARTSRGLAVLLRDDAAWHALCPKRTLRTDLWKPPVVVRKPWRAIARRNHRAVRFEREWREELSEQREREEAVTEAMIEHRAMLREQKRNKTPDAELTNLDVFALMEESANSMMWHRRSKEYRDEQSLMFRPFGTTTERLLSARNQMIRAQFDEQESADHVDEFVPITRAVHSRVRLFLLNPALAAVQQATVRAATSSIDFGR